MNPTSLSVVIPTFNEPELLARTVDSLQADPSISIQIVVGNAGEPLPEELAKKVVEIQVSSDKFWTGSIRAAMEYVKQHRTEYIMFLNADTSMLPGSIENEVEWVGDDARKVACCPAYARFPDGRLELLYSHQSDWGILKIGKLIKPWQLPSEAPTEPYQVDLHGGQGTLFRTELLDRFDLDERNFPHYAADHDFWLTLREHGIHLWVVPTGGIVNDREFGAHSSKSFSQKMKSLWKRMSSPLLGESAPTMWRLRKKHLPFPVSLASFLLAFGMRWTLGLPKIWKRL